MRTMPNSRHKFSRAAIFDTAYEVRRRGADASRRVQSRSRQRRRGVTPAGGSSTTFVSNANYEPFGPLQSFGYGNGLNLTRAYDADYRLTGITLAPATGAALLNLGFSWQTDGRLSGVTDSAGTGRAASYTYTNSGRVLTGVASGLWGSDTYAYDANGNLTQTGATASPVSITVATSSNRITTTALSGSTQRTFTYRTGGDLSIDKPAGASAYNYTYNAAKRLSGVSKGSTAKGAYGYDFAGRRVWRQTFGSGAAQTAYVFDTDGHVLAEENAVSGAMTKEYVWLDDSLVGMFIVQSGGTVARFVTTGQIDEPLVITQSNKNVAWSGYADPYGNQGTLSGNASLLDLRLPGQWYEAEGNASGLHQNGYRDYDPSLGRYTEADPLGVDAGANLYGYADGDPVNEWDPHGLDLRINYYNSLTGHIGISISGHPSYGFYPNVNVPASNGCECQDALRSTVPLTASFTIPSTASQDAAMWSYIEKRIGNPGVWFLLGNNCATTVEDILRAGRFNDVPNDIVPWRLYQHLRQLFDPNWSTDSGENLLP